MKNIETPDKKHLASIISELRDGKYGIPDFQRDFEWSPWDVTELVKSIFEDYYIGTLLLWRASKENIEYLSCKPIYGSTGTSKFDHIVLDGQQRLSALFYALFSPDKVFPRRKSKFYYIVYIEKLLDGNFDEAFDYLIASKKTDAFINNVETQFEERIFPLRTFGQSSHEWYRWLENYEEFWKNKGFGERAKEEREKLYEIFNSTLNEYYISYIELDREIAVEKVCDIFQRINSTGLDLNIFDLMNALLRPKEIKLKELWQKEISDLQPKLPDSEKGKIYALQTMSILEQVYSAPKYLYYLVPNSLKLIKEGDGSFKKITLIDSKERFLDLWNASLDGMKKALKVITNHSDLGVIKPKFFPYPSMLPIFTALNIEKTKPQYIDKDSVENKIRYWYWSSIFTNHYSSSVESKMAKDYLEMKKWFLDDDTIPTVVDEARKSYVNMDLDREDNQNSAIYKAIFCILIRGDAKDFSSYVSPVYSELEDHHIVPRSWGIKNKVSQINSILNRTPISDDTNRNIIHDHLPNIYIQEIFDQTKNKEAVYDLFDSHLISRKSIEILMRDEFTESDFVEFLAERKMAIMKKVKELIGAGTEIERKIDKDANSTINDLEINLRSFIDTILKNEYGSDYWEQRIPGDVKANIDKRIDTVIRKNPFIKINSGREKIDYIDFSEYFQIIRLNWELFERYFVTKEQCVMHFNHLIDYRNPEKHVREKGGVTKKLGEAAMEWLNVIISNSNSSKN